MLDYNHETLAPG